MPKLTWYEIRRRGEFMMPGNYVEAENYQMAMMDPKGGNQIDSIVIGYNDGAWWLVSADGSLSRPRVTIPQGTNVHAFDNNPQRRLALAKKCEKFCQSREKNPTLEFADFDRQLSEYEKEYNSLEEDRQIMRKYYEGKSVHIAARCLKDCALAETNTSAGEKDNAGCAMLTANSYRQEAKILAEASRAPGDTKSNSADKAAAEAQKQFEKTTNRIEQFEGKKMFINKTQVLNVN